MNIDDLRPKEFLTDHPLKARYRFAINGIFSELHNYGISDYARAVYHNIISWKIAAYPLYMFNLIDYAEEVCADDFEGLKNVFDELCKAGFLKKVNNINKYYNIETKSEDIRIQIHECIDSLKIYKYDGRPHIYKLVHSIPINTKPIVKNRYVRPEEVLTRSIKNELIRNANNRCNLCGTGTDEARLTIDHIVPLRKGGQDRFSNYRVLCQECNNSEYATKYRGGAYIKCNKDEVKNV